MQLAFVSLLVTNYKKLKAQFDNGTEMTPDK